jgi:hypothetical protein
MENENASFAWNHMLSGYVQIKCRSTFNETNEPHKFIPLGLNTYTSIVP